MSTSYKTDKKAHICPPSNAKHPSDRWESLFVYSFICKFTNLRQKVEGLESPMDLEDAILSKEPTGILSKVLVQFIVNLKPQTRNLSTDQISTTVATVLSEYFKSSERTMFWNEEIRANVDPFEGLEGGFFAADWDFKLKILRLLVELQMCHGPDIKATIDRAWGVQHNKHKKNQAPVAVPDPSDPKSRERLVLLPIGQDFQRKRYWIADDSPRIYVSTNPWKITATFQTISTTREEYVSVIERLRSTMPPPQKKGRKPTKPELSHTTLVDALEARIEAIDAELARVQRVRRKIEQRQILYAQAEIRQTRTRRKTQKPDYVYNNEFSEDDGGDEYTYQEEGQEEDDEPDYLNDGFGARRGRSGAAAVGTRRSARTTTLNANGKREGSSDSGLWRGERRSTRLGGLDVLMDDEPSHKRARTEESSISTHSTDPPVSDNHGLANGVRVKTAGAAALKPTEVAVEEIAGKKRSKFWVYAVEPIPEPVKPPPSSDGDVDMKDIKSEPDIKSDPDSPPPKSNGRSIKVEGQSIKMEYDRSLEGSLSPVQSP